MSQRPRSWCRMAVVVGVLALLGPAAASPLVGDYFVKISGLEIAAGRLVLVTGDGNRLSLGDGTWRSKAGTELVIEKGRPVRAIFEPDGRPTEIHSMRLDGGRLVFNGNGDAGVGMPVWGKTFRWVETAAGPPTAVAGQPSRFEVEKGRIVGAWLYK